MIDKVSGHAIRDNGQGLHVATTDVGDDVILAMLKVGVERYGNRLEAHGDDEFQLRIAQVAGAHHLEVSFGDPALERARLGAKAITPAPSNKAACAYIAERNSKRDRMRDIPFHRLWQPADAGQLNFAGFRLVGRQNLLLVSNGNETLVLPITHQQRQELAPQQRGIALTITSAVVIQAHTHGLGHAIFAQAFGIGSLVTIGCFFLLLLDVARANFRVNPYLHGSARWADARDIKAAGLLGNDGVYVGAWTDKAGKTHYLRHAGPEHILCYAPTRSGKGVGLIVPTLLSWRQSVFVTDLKGELYELSSGWRHQYAHNRILRFEPAAASGSCCFNPTARAAVPPPKHSDSLQAVPLPEVQIV